MVNLILVIVSLSLTAATLFAAINYLPIGASQSAEVYSTVKTGLVALEKAYLAKVAANGGVAPVPDATTDGGLAANFRAQYVYLPKAPLGFSWKYASTGPNYLMCLYPNGATTGATDSQFKGLNRLRNIFPAAKYYLAPGGASVCNSVAPGSPYVPTTFPNQLSASYIVK